MLKRIFSPRIAETNIYGHIRLDAVVVWLGESAMEIEKLLSAGQTAGPGMISANLNVDLLREIVLGNDVDVMTGVEKIGNSSFVLRQQVYQKQKLCARGLTTFIFFDYGERRPKPIPEAVRSLLQAHQVSE